MSESPFSHSTLNARRRRRARRAAMLRTLLGMILAPALALLVCMIAQHVNRRVYLPLDPDTRLSPRLVQSLENFPASLTITALMPPSHRAFQPTARLLRAIYAASQTYLHPVAFELVDPLRDLTRASALFQDGAQENSLILKTEHAQASIPADELFEKSPAGESSYFVGDRLLADTLRTLNREPELPLYWLTGHGEGALDDYGPTGFSDIARELRRKGYPSHPLNLLVAQSIPRDAAALVIVAPRRAFAPEELTLVTDYLDKGGKLLYFAGDTPLAQNEDFLLKWELQLTPYHAVGGRQFAGDELLTLSYPPHPATKSLAGSATLFASPRVIERKPSTPAQTHLALLPVARTGDSDWGAINPGASRQFNPQTDIPGPVVFIMTAEHGDQVVLRNTRIVLAGGARFASNLFLQRRASANIELVINLVDWLTGAPTITSADTHAGLPLALNLGRRGWFTLALLTAGAIPGIPFILLMIRCIRRR